MSEMFVWEQHSTKLALQLQTYLSPFTWNISIVLINQFISRKQFVNCQLHSYSQQNYIYSSEKTHH